MKSKHKAKKNNQLDITHSDNSSKELTSDDERSDSILIKCDTNAISQRNSDLLINDIRTERNFSDSASSESSNNCGNDSIASIGKLSEKICDFEKCNENVEELVEYVMQTKCQSTETVDIKLVQGVANFLYGNYIPRLCMKNNKFQIARSKEKNIDQLDLKNEEQVISLLKSIIFEIVEKIYNSNLYNKSKTKTVFLNSTLHSVLESLKNHYNKQNIHSKLLELLKTAVRNKVNVRVKINAYKKLQMILPRYEVLYPNPIK